MKELILTVTGADESAIIEGTTRLLADRVHDEVKKLVKATVEREVQAHVDRFSETAIREAVEAVLAEGWQKTDQWGEARGQRMSLKERIGEWLSGKSDSYARETRVEKIVAATVEATLKGELQGQVESAKILFRKQLDAVLTGKFAEAMKAALRA